MIHILTEHLGEKVDNAIAPLYGKKFPFVTMVAHYVNSLNEMIVIETESVGYNGQLFDLTS